MLVSFAHERYLDHLMRNSMGKASSGYFAFCKAHREGQRPRCPIRRRTGNEDVAPPVWLNPARSSQSKFQETIVPRVPLVSHVPPRHLQSAEHKAFHLAIRKARSSLGGVSPPLNQAELRDGRRRCCTGRPNGEAAFGAHEPTRGLARRANPCVRISTDEAHRRASHEREGPENTLSALPRAERLARA